MNIVFDFGVVLFTWRPADILAGAFPQRAADSPSAAQLAHAVFGHADWHAFDRGTLPMDAVIERTAQRLSLDHATLQATIEGIGAHLKPVEGSVQVLRQLHEARRSGAIQGLYFLSNMPVPYARYLEANHDFLSLFDGGIFSGDVHLIKPEPEIYLALQQRYALVPEQTLFIDDLQHNVDAAIALGWKGFHFTGAPGLASFFSKTNAA